MLPRADFSSQPDAAAAELFASVRAPAPCTRMNVASAAAASTARTTRLVTSPPSLRFPLPGREPRHRRRRYGRRGGDAEVTKWGLVVLSGQPRARQRGVQRGPATQSLFRQTLLQPARLGSTEQTARFGLDESHPVDHQLERRLGRAPRLVRADGEEPLELTLVAAERLEAFLDRPQQLGYRLADALLQVAVAPSRPLGDADRLHEAIVEALGDVARQLEMLALVVADRHEVGLVEQDVAGHQDGIREEPGRDELLALGLLLELHHAAQLAVARHGRKEPRRFGVRGHVALTEDRRPLRVEPAREEQCREIERRAAQLSRVVLDRDRVQVDDAEEAVPGLLGLHVLAKPPAVVAEGLPAGGLNAGEDAWFEGGHRDS